MNAVEASAELDWVAIGTLLVVVATLLLAAATFWLGFQARAEVAQSRAGEVARRAELHILESDPLSARQVPLDWDQAGELTFAIEVQNVGDRPVTAITATIRSNDNDLSESPGWGSLAPGEQHIFRYRLSPYIGTPEPNQTGTLEALVDHCEIVVESHGLFGQRVIQTFRLRVDRMVAGESDGILYLTRQEIVPAVLGGSSSVVTFTRH